MDTTKHSNSAHLSAFGERLAALQEAIGRDDISAVRQLLNDMWKIVRALGRQSPAEVFVQYGRSGDLVDGYDGRPVAPLLPAVRRGNSSIVLEILRRWWSGDHYADAWDARLKISIGLAMAAAHEAGHRHINDLLVKHAPEDAKPGWGLEWCDMSETYYDVELA